MDLGRIVNEWDSDAVLRPFGSVSNGFRLKDKSDIDLTIITEEKKDIHPQDYSSSLLALLNERTDWHWMRICSNRLFLFQATYRGFEIEILFNNIAGLVNSEYIRAFAEYDIRFHKLGIYLKHFIESNNLFTKQNKLNSFSVMCMLIVFLQDVVKPPVLPRIIDDMTKPPKISEHFCLIE